MSRTRYIALTTLERAENDRDGGISVLALASIVSFSPLIEGGTTHLAAMILRLLLLSLLAVYWATAVREAQFRWPRLSVDLPIVGYLMLALLWTIFSPYVNQSVQWLIVLVGYAMLLYLAVWVLDRSPRLDEWVLILLIILGLGQSFLALYQRIGSEVSRSTGTFFNPNFLAGYLASVFMIVFAQLCYLNWRWHGTAAKRLRSVRIAARCVAIMALLFCGIMLTGSRGGILALCVGAGVITAIRMGWRGVVAALLCSVMIVAIPNRIRDRAFYEYRSNPESYARIQMWEAALAEIGDHPFGIGLGLYQYTYPQYAFPIEERMFRYGKTAQTPHSEFLQMAIELSVASVACMGLGVLTLFRTTHQILRSRVRRSTRSVVAGSTAGTVVILTQAAVDSNLHEPGVTILLVLFVAIILALHRLLQRQVKRDFVIQLHGRGLWVTIGMLLICVLGWQVVRLAAAHAAYESGSDFMRRGAFESAVEQYRQAVNLDAGKALYHSALAGAYLAMYDRHGNAAAAQRTIDEFQTALDLNPLDGRLAGLLADAYARFAGSLRVPTPDASIQRRQWIIKAIELSERASRQEPMSFRYPFQRAHYHLQLKETERSLTMIRRTLEIEPNFLPARELLIHLYLDTGAIEAARSEYEQIILRRLRYASWDRDVREEQFLQINLDKIRSEFKRKGVSLP